MEFLRRKKQEQPSRTPEGQDVRKSESLYTDAVVEAFERQFGAEASGSRREMVREIADSFFRENLGNAQLRDSETHKTSYPWGFIDTGTLSKKIYERVTGKTIGPLKEPEHPLKKQKEFIFGSLLFRMHGTPFIFQEEALHQFTKTLQTSIDAIEKGEEPSSREVYMFGSPTNHLGKMSDDFIQEIQQKGAFRAFSGVYAEHIEEILSKDGPDVNARLVGISLGAALATETAQRVLEDGKATQKEGEDGPHLSVHIKTAPGSSHTPPGLKAIQTAIGFGLDSAQATKRDPYIAKAWEIEGKFVEDINAKLAARGMTVNSSADQVSMKQKGLRSLVSNLLKGSPIPNDMRVTEEVGLDDWLTYSPFFNKEARSQRDERENSLQKYLVTKEGEGGGRKRYGIDMAHVPPFYRQNELKRLNRAAERLELAKARASAPQENP
jgi:hypothetical protein